MLSPLTHARWLSHDVPLPQAVAYTHPNSFSSRRRRLQNSTGAHAQTYPPPPLFHFTPRVCLHTYTTSRSFSHGTTFLHHFVTFSSHLACVASSLHDFRLLDYFVLSGVLNRSSLRTPRTIISRLVLEAVISLLKLVFRVFV